MNQFIEDKEIEMKKIILLTLTALLMVGCDKKMSDGTYRTNGSSYRTYIIDSCEYFGVLDWGNGNFLAHKGNCRFCKERRQKELEDIVKQLKQK